MLGRVALMVGGATVAVLVSGGTLAPVAGAAIMGGAGLVVGGGTELANQVQSGEEINATAILNRAVGEGAKSTLFQIPGASLLGLGLGTAGIAAAENVGDNLAKGRTSAQDMQQAVEGAAVEGGAVIAVGKATELISSALSKVSAKVAEKAAAKEPVKPLPDEALERVAGGAKDPEWRPGASCAGKTGEIITKYPDITHYKFNAVQNPGPLAKIERNPASNFFGGRYNMEVLSEDRIYYRAGNSENPWGQWFTREPAKSAAQVRSDLAVKAQWIDPKTGALDDISKLDSVYAIKIPKGTTVYEGPVGYWTAPNCADSTKSPVW